MSIIQRHLETLAAADRWTYRAAAESATEPAAWAAMALAAHGNARAAARPAAWLAELQQRDGSVGVSAAEAEPRWPTSLAMLAWSLVDRAADARRFLTHVGSAAQWSLAEHGKPAPRSPEIGHDTTLVGWPWAADTASWLEPTCYFVLGLTAAGFADHTRVREGRAVVADRLLPDGGANYGNTTVLGQQLLPHIAPTGIALTVLAGAPRTDDRVEKSLAFLEGAIGPDTAPASLSWACIGLAAHNRRPPLADPWIEGALQGDDWQPLAAYEQALLLLAAAPNFLSALPGPA